MDPKHTQPPAPVVSILRRGLHPLAKRLRKEHDVPYVVGMRLIRERGEAEVQRWADRGYDEALKVSNTVVALGPAADDLLEQVHCFRRDCVCALPHAHPAANAAQALEHCGQPTQHGVCLACGAVTDTVMGDDACLGPKIVVRMSAPMLTALMTLRGSAGFVAITAGPHGGTVTARRDALDRIHGDLANLGRSNHEDAPIARHAAARIAAALFGAKA